MAYTERMVSNTVDTGEWQVLTVAELSRCIRGVIEAEDLFRDVCVRGEVSNLIRHASGHVYFSLKDEAALLRAVIWRGSCGGGLTIENGMRVVARGRVTVYEKQGQYQLTVNEITPDGVGALYVALEKLKAKLSAEGLFDESRKQPMPSIPRRIAIVTSPTAAALRDMVTIARRRMPGLDLLLVPALMQGTEAAGSVSESLCTADGLDGIDVIVLGRGGGSIEDLWTFNSEAVVRAIDACRTPVVSAIGHETDFTLADFAADLRAPTPSAAMELIVPDSRESLGRLRSLEQSLRASMERIVSDRSRTLDYLVNSPCMKYPERMIEDRWQSVDLLIGKAQASYKENMSRHERRLGEASARLQTLSPLGVLARGYGIVRKPDGTVVKNLSELNENDEIRTLLSDGVVTSRVTDLKEGWD